jgi:hypothetical protein
MIVAKFVTNTIYIVKFVTDNQCICKISGFRFASFSPGLLSTPYAFFYNIICQICYYKSDNLYIVSVTNLTLHSVSNKSDNLYIASVTNLTMYIADLLLTLYKLSDLLLTLYINCQIYY